MGWYGNNNRLNRKDLIAELTEDHNFPVGEKEEKRHIEGKCLKHCFRGGSFSGVLWSVWEKKRFKDKVLVETIRYIVCDLFRYDKGDGWFYKPMDESMNPFYYSCPLGYLNMVPVASEDWRVGVKRYHENSLDKRRRKAGRKAFANNR